MEVVALAVLERRDASPLVLGDPRRELDSLAFEVLDNRLECRFGLKGYDGTTSGPRPLGLPAVEPDVEPVGVDLGSGTISFDHRKAQSVLLEV